MIKIDWGGVATALAIGVVLLLYVAPLILAIWAALVGNISGALVLLVIQLIIWLVLG